jgi:hypothetical protein
MLFWVPVVSGQQTSAAVPQPVAPAVAVQMIDLVDSSRDPAGKQYRAGLIRPVNIGNGLIIAQGSAATVVLVKNGSGWNVQLSSLVIKGQVTTVTSNPGTVIGAAAQSNVANAANAANAVLGGFGRKPNTYSPAAVVAMGDRVVLTPGISVSFVLSAIPVVPEPSPASAPAPVAKQPAAGQSVPTQARVQPGTIYFCQTSTMNPTIYRSGVFQVAPNTSQGSISNAWDAHVRQIYHLGNVYLNSGCSQGNDPTGQQFIQPLEQTAKENKSQIVIVDWKYVPGQDSSLPAPVAPTPVASGKGNPTYCSGAIRGGDMYFSDIFEVPPDTGRESNVRQDYRFGFARFVVEKYGLSDKSWDGGGELHV